MVCWCRIGDSGGTQCRFNSSSAVSDATLARDGTKRDCAEIALRLVEYINADSVKHALPMVIELANPNTRALVGIPNRSTVVRPEMLEALWVSHQTTILDGITTLLESRRRELVEHAGRGLSALQAHDSKQCCQF